MIRGADYIIDDILLFIDAYHLLRFRHYFIAATFSLIIDATDYLMIIIYVAAAMPLMPPAAALILDAAAIPATLICALLPYAR